MRHTQRAPEAPRAHQEGVRLVGMNHAATFVVFDHARASQHTREPRLTPHAHMQPELQAVILASCSDLYTRSSARTHSGSIR